MRSLRLPTVAGLLLLLSAGSASAMFASRESRPRQPVQVVVVPGLSVADLTGLANRGAAIGLLVPSAGPRTSERMAFEAMIRGLLYNARVGKDPRGRILIDARYSRAPPGHGPAIILGLPSTIVSANDRRYPIAVFGYGYHGLLLSPLTRVPGLVSMADVVPTALQWRSERGASPIRCRGSPPWRPGSRPRAGRRCRA